MLEGCSAQKLTAVALVSLAPPLPDMLRGRCARGARLLCRPQPLLGRGFSTEPPERIRWEPIVPVSGSLIPETLAEMDAAGSEFSVNAEELRKVGKARLSLQERKRRRRALNALGVPDFAAFLEQEVRPARASEA